MPKYTVLTVDDSATIRNIIKTELNTVGYEVLTAKNGIEALSIIEWSEKLPDLITLDIDMPVMGGFEVCEKLQALKDDPLPKKQAAARIPILFVSANDSLENRRRGFRLEIIDFIAKPFPKGDIIRAVNKVLRPDLEFRGMYALVVEDSDRARRVISNILRRKGLEVVEAKNGLQALEIIDQQNATFDLVTIDQTMPEMCGDEFCSILRQRKDMAQVPKFFVSADNDRESTLQFFKSGATDYLCKPFIDEEFQARVDIHLRARKYVRELERLNEKLRFISIRDPLTGLYNRAYFQERLEQRYAHARKSNAPLSAILFDIDHFKNINDEYGHGFGDVVLVDFANILKTKTPKKDIAGRYGGEEFVLILANCDSEKAMGIAESIRCACASYAFSDRKICVRVTLSAGVASLPEAEVDKPNELLSLADQALYQAKESGRNRVCLFGSSTTGAALASAEQQIDNGKG